MPYDTLIMGLIVFLVCGAACFYLYMRISFIERKGNMMESVIVDLKVAIDALMTSGQGGGGSPVPISPAPQPVEISAPEPLSSAEAENIPEESFYSSVLEQAHDESAPEASTESKSFDEVVASMSVAETEVEPELDGMTKNDLLALAEKRGLRAKKSSSRDQLLTLLRRSSPLQNSGLTSGAEHVSGSTGTPSAGAASLDGSINVDLGQGSSLE
jgi:hypothetical protein